jgi:hypothetical protein
MKASIWVLTVVIVAGTVQVRAQTSDPGTAPSSEAASSATATATDAPTSPPSAAPAAAATCCRIPAGTVIELEIAEPLSSAVKKRGDKFALKLHAPIEHDGTVVVPIGADATGEIVHAEASHGGGKPGELLLAARYLEHEGAQVPLRGLKFGSVGRDKTNAALAASFGLGPFALFIHGKEIEIPSGTIVNAKLAQDFVLSAPTMSDAPATAVPAPPTATPTSTN